MRRFAWMAVAGLLLAACSEAAVKPQGGGGDAGAGGSGGSSGAGGSGGAGGGAGAVVVPGWDGTGTWEPTNGPLGFWHNSGLFGGSGGDLLLLGARELLRSRNGGATWAAVASTKGTTGQLVQAGGALLLSDGVRLLRSQDGGATWTDAGAAPTWLLADGAFAYAAWEDDAVGLALFRSEDGGATWHERGDLPSPQTTRRLWAGDGLLLLTDLYGPDPGLYRSEDGGASWSHVDDSDPVAFSVDFARSGSILFALATSEGIHRSFDDGRTWAVVPLPESQAPTGFRGFVHAAGQLFASTGAGVYLWNEASGEWETAALTAPDGLLTLAGTNEALYAASRTALYRWDEKDLAFVPVETTFAGTRLLNVVAGAGKAFATGLGGDTYRRTEQGWVSEPQLTGVQSLTWAGGGLWIGSGEGMLQYSLDDGVSFLLDPSLRGRSFSFVGEPNALFALVDGAPWFCDNYVRGWDDLRNAMPGVDDGPVSFVRLGLAADRLFGTTDGDGVWTSDDRGHSWAQAATEQPLRDFTSVGDTLVAASPGSASRRLWRSADRGASWTAIEDDLPACTWPQQLGEVEDALVAVLARGCPEGGAEVERAIRQVWTSLDAGATWKPVGAPLPAPVTGFSRDGDTLWVATDGAGAWRLRIE